MNVNFTITNPFHKIKYTKIRNKDNTIVNIRNILFFFIRLIKK